jgi:mono/diheme cytochrome c family protein
MLTTTALVVADLATGNKIALAAIGAAFIVFALISSLVVPRVRPNFPGRSVGLYSTVSVCFLVGMIVAVILLGKETESSSAAESSTPAPATTTSGAAPTTTTTGGGSTGDAAAGKAVFASAGCAGCHTLKAAGATGNVGPNLDDLKPSEATVQHQVENGGGAMPSFEGTLTAQQIADVAAFVSSSAGQ